MSEKKVYAMAPEGGLDYVTAGKVYLTRPFYKGGDDSEAMEYCDPDFDSPWCFSTWKCSTHLNGGDWKRLELTDEEAEAINANLQERPEGAACDSDIDWKRVPFWANYLVQRDDGRYVAFENRPVIFADEWVKQDGMHEALHFGPNEMDWRDTLQKRPSDQLESHPNSELDADECSVVADTISIDWLGLTEKWTEFWVTWRERNGLSEKSDDNNTLADCQQSDLVNTPSHYTSGEIECIDAIQAQMTPEQFAGYLRGNCVEYIWRYQHKGGKESLLEARRYLNRLIDVVED